MTKDEDKRIEQLERKLADLDRKLTSLDKTAESQNEDRRRDIQGLKERVSVLEQKGR